MRRGLALWMAVSAGLIGWVAAAAVIGEPRRANAQATPPVEINRVQDAAFLPGENDRQIITVLAIGSDARPGDDVASHLADSLHLITVNPKKQAATILGFPRDSYVEIPGVGTRKINETLFSGGPEKVAETIEGLTGIPIDYYLLTGFEGFKRMVSGIGGLEVHIPYAMNDSSSGAVFGEGPAELDGAQALAFTRNRKDTPNGDFSRSENQGLILQAAQAKLRHEAIPTQARLFQWIIVGVQNLETDMSIGELFSLGLVASSLDPLKVTNLVVPGSTGSAGDASVVFISDAAQDIYADIRDDGIIG